jgi:low affinity Fe/Cu permease
MELWLMAISAILYFLTLYIFFLQNQQIDFLKKDITKIEKYIDDIRFKR